MIVGIVFTVLELRNLTKTRKTDLIVRLYSTLGSKDFLEAWEKFRFREITDYDNYKKKYGFVELNTVSDFFEGIGVLISRKLIDVGLVGDFFSVEISGHGKNKAFCRRG